MRAYLVTTGIIFALFALSHVWITIDRIRAGEADHALPAAVIAVLATGLTVWAVRLAPGSAEAAGR
jgi:hypothetical protein